MPPCQTAHMHFSFLTATLWCAHMFPDSSSASPSASPLCYIALPHLPDGRGRQKGQKREWQPRGMLGVVAWQELQLNLSQATSWTVLSWTITTGSPFCITLELGYLSSQPIFTLISVTFHLVLRDLLLPIIDPGCLPVSPTYYVFK